MCRRNNFLNNFCNTFGMKGSGVLTCKYVVFLCFQEGLVTMHDLLDAQWVYDNTKDGRFNNEKSPGFP